MAGEVKRPALYEVVAGETLQDVINFSGGFSDVAYTARVKALQIVDQQRSITDVFEADFKNYTPLRGDKYIVERILERFKNRVVISGAVQRPGDYELEKGLTISKLIAKAAGLSEDAFTSRGSITRLKPDKTTENISFNVLEVINKKATDIPLQREDLVTIASIFDLRDAYNVTIKGEVRQPGSFAYSDSLTIEDLIIKAGGLTEGAATKRIEVSRRINNANPNAANGTIAQVFNISINNNLDLSGTSFTLKPFDIVSVYTSPGFEKQRTVKVEGEVLYPGFYTIKQKNERISDLVTRAGGLTSSAYIAGGTLKRENTAILGFDKSKADTNAIKQEHINRIKNLSQSLKDTSTVEKNEGLRNNYVGIDLESIIEKPNSKTDLILEDGDVLRIPKQQQVVRINGEVLFPSSVVYSKGKSFKSYVSNAGGFSDYASKGRAYVVYPNGTVKGTSKFLFFRSYPGIKPGSEVYVPKKQIKRGISTVELIGITGGLASLGAIVLGIINLSR
jgi:protein involved in polysaccharide export with SLBB domain